MNAENHVTLLLIPIVMGLAATVTLGSAKKQGIPLLNSMGKIKSLLYNQLLPFEFYSCVLGKLKKKTLMNYSRQ